MVILRNKVFSMVDRAISKVLKKNTTRFKDEEIEDFLNEHVYKLRKNRARQQRNINNAKEQSLGTYNGIQLNTEHQATNRASQLALRNKFDTEEVKLVENKSKNILKP